MELTYRGIKYPYTPPTVASAPSSIYTEYKGLDVRFRSKDEPVQPLKVEMAQAQAPTSANQTEEKLVSHLYRHALRSLQRQQQKSMRAKQDLQFC
ncbi:DUF4278 domain-containing protein [Synechococcus elongatus]|uniref:DUF4278 domain-containing protein n=1 Tax=Synechococcus elongatus PCC 11801 TaxID=2219813 RepID=A0AAN1UTX4_SYNEL|nr:DUF4278 domain-containing protein [Synechococcus elongatus]AZB71976.1 hypothetical protein DOP62_03840 [Synechococcus elongatus PCC 11801]